MILVAEEFTSDSSTAPEKSMRDNQSNFAVSNIGALILTDKCLVSDEKIPFNNSFALNDYTICHSTKMKIRDGCDGTNKINTRG